MTARVGARPRPVVVTMGEPSGVAGEILIKARLALAGGVPFAAIADPSQLQRDAARLGVSIDIHAIDDLSQTEEAFARGLPVLPEALAAPARPGEIDRRNAPAVIRAIERAVRLSLDGRAGGVVTCPIHKSALIAAGFSYPGHTEFLAALCGADGAPAKVAMMLACDALRVVPLTVHCALADAPQLISIEKIVEVGHILAAALKRDFGVASPRIRVAGLNPHAGEDGRFGDEEKRIIAPAVANLRAAGVDATGPFPADTLFHAEARVLYDAALCMYHDQALIPLKTLDFAGGVNVTLGLPIVRTSPDHGTAFDIAGKGVANSSSLIAAIRMAEQMAARREAARHG